MDKELSSEILHHEVVTLHTDKFFDVEFDGPVSVERAFVMVHGFGVRRDSRGLFTDIEQNLEDNMLSIRGNFSDITPSYADVVPLSSQLARLRMI